MGKKLQKSTWFIVKGSQMSYYYNKKALVTGGAGFIGSHIVRLLLAQGARVIVLDNLSNSSKIIAHEIQTITQFIEGDIRNSKICVEASKDCDVIFHCAAFVSVPLSFKEPITCYETNYLGTKNLLEAALKNNVHHFVFSSSAVVYGNRNESCKEDMELMNLSPYAHSKIDAEKICRKYAHSISTVILRYFNVYDLDPIHQNRHSVISRFCENITHHKPVTIYGNGLQKRDFIHVAEVAQANLLFGMSKFKGDIFNIGSGHSISLFELFDDLIAVLQQPKPPIQFEPEREGDIKNSIADCTKYQQFASSKPDFILNFTIPCRGGEIGRHARFRF